MTIQLNILSLSFLQVIALQALISASFAHLIKLLPKCPPLPEINRFQPEINLSVACLTHATIELGTYYSTNSLGRVIYGLMKTVIRY